MIVAVIPVKRLDEAKSRLAVALPRRRRKAMMVMLARRVVTAVRESGMVDQIALVTPESLLALRLGVEHLPDPGSLNGALSGGVAWALSLGAERLLILPADLPLLTAEDVRVLLDDAGIGPEIGIAATDDGGTGALLLTPPDAIPTSFGGESFTRHLSLAGERGVRVRIVERPAFARDLDTTVDLDAIASHFSAG